LIVRSGAAVDIEASWPEVKRKFRTTDEEEVLNANERLSQAASTALKISLL
jgi:hypothetical protein